MADEFSDLPSALPSGNISQGGAQDRYASAAKLLEFRVGSLFTSFGSVELATAAVSAGEYAYFVRSRAEAGNHHQPDHWQEPAAPAGRELAAVAGIRGSDGQAFCHWLTQWCVEKGLGGGRFRLPTLQESQVSTKTGLPPGLQDLHPRNTRTWLCDGVRVAGGAPAPPVSQAIKEYLHALFFADLWLVVYPGLLLHLRVGMPPERSSDADFNDHYESDRKWVTRYAGDVESARKRLLQLAENLGHEEHLVRLSFDPLRNLRPYSPLNAYRDEILDTYRELVESVRPNDSMAIRGTINRWEEGAYRGRSGDVEHDGFCAEFAGVLDRMLEFPLDIESVYAHLRATLDCCRDDEASSASSKPPDTASCLQTIVRRDPKSCCELQLARLLALESAGHTWNSEDEEPDFFRRILGGAQARPGVRLRDDYLSAYCALLLIKERMKGVLDPWEGLRLVREH